MGYIIGLKSSVLGIGGGTLSIPFLTWTGKKMHEAVVISAAIGSAIAFFGTLSYMIIGSFLTPESFSLPPYSIGYIYLPALIGISLTSAIAARLGANVSHKIDPKKLRQIFKCLLIVLLTKSSYSLFFK